MRQQLRLCISYAVTGVDSIDIFIVVTFGFQHASHSVVRLCPVVHPIPHDIGAYADCSCQAFQPFCFKVEKASFLQLNCCAIQ